MTITNDNKNDHDNCSVYCLHSTFRHVGWKEQKREKKKKIPMKKRKEKKIFPKCKSHHNQR